MTRIGLICFCLPVCAVSARATDKPNMVIIFNDDQGYQDLGCFGSPDIKTPRVDQMAREGVRLTDFYVASPVCSASRAALLTGRYPQLVGVRGVFWPNHDNQGLDPRHVTIAETLKSVGYTTAAVGKWHLGDHPQYLPTNQGFDSYFGIPYSNDMYPAAEMLYATDCHYRLGQSPDSLRIAFGGELRNQQPRSLKGMVPLMEGNECIEFPADQSTLTRRYVDRGIHFVSASVAAERPFFLYLANTMPHIPLHASDEFLGRSERGLYGDVIEEIDYHTGRLLDHLRELGVEENTLVVFTSDNGPWLSAGDAGGCAAPLFEGKFTAFEGGHRVPCVIRWPSRIPPGSVCSEMVSAMDLHPTLATIAGAELAEQPLDGQDVTDLLTRTRGARSPHEFLFLVFQGEAVRMGQWKYHAKMHFAARGERHGRTAPALYDLQNDIGETTNLIAERPEIAGQMKAALDDHRARIQLGRPDE